MAGYILLVVCAYFAGAVPFAYIVVKLVKGIDIRTVGSGNAGATNVARVLGKWGFVVVFLLDSLKGFVPVYISLSFYGLTPVTLVVAVAVILGHTYTVFLSFKGGKGVATAAGVFLALAPISLLIALVAFLLVFAVTRMVSAGSIVAAIVLLIGVIVLSSWFWLQILTAIIVVFVIYKHRANVVRILKGTENRFGKKA